MNQSAYTVNENSSVSFQCIARGVPKPSITWYRNGIMIYNKTDIRISISSMSTLLSSLIYCITEILTLTDAQDNDSNTNYYCTATNVAGNNTDKFSLDVLGEIMFLFISHYYCCYSCSCNNWSSNKCYNNTATFCVLYMYC